MRRGFQTAVTLTLALWRDCGEARVFWEKCINFKGEIYKSNRNAPEKRKLCLAGKQNREKGNAGSRHRNRREAGKSRARSAGAKCRIFEGFFVKTDKDSWFFQENVDKTPDLMVSSIYRTKQRGTRGWCGNANAFVTARETGGQTAAPGNTDRRKKWLGQFFLSNYRGIARIGGFLCWRSWIRCAR